MQGQGLQSRDPGPFHQSRYPGIGWPKEHVQFKHDLINDMSVVHVKKLVCLALKDAEKVTILDRNWITSK